MSKHHPGLRSAFLNLSDEEWRQLRVISAERGISMTNFMSDHLRKLIAREYKRIGQKEMGEEQ